MTKPALKIRSVVPRPVVEAFASARFERDHIVTPDRRHLWLGLDAPHGTKPAELATVEKTWGLHGAKVDRATHYGMTLDVFRALHTAALDPARVELHLVPDPDAAPVEPMAMLKPAEKAPAGKVAAPPPKLTPEEEQAVEAHAAPDLAEPAVEA